MWPATRNSSLVRLNHLESRCFKSVAHPLKTPEICAAHSVVEFFAVRTAKESQERTSTGPQHPSKLLKDLGNSGGFGVDQRVPRKDASKGVRLQWQPSEITTFEVHIGVGGSRVANELL